MNRQKITQLTLLTIFVLVAGTFVSKAQIGPPPPPGPPVGAPLDPISWVLLGAGGVAAGKKYYDKKKQKNNDQDL